jgi:hypothetical protein
MLCHHLCLADGINNDRLSWSDVAADAFERHDDVSTVCHIEDVHTFRMQWGTAKGRGSLSEVDQKSMPAAGLTAAWLFFGFSATMASVVINRLATDAASCRAVRTTLAGSMMPLPTRSP